MVDPIDADGLFARGLFHNEPPGLQTRQDMKPTLLVSWWTTSFAIAIILVRVGGRYIRTGKLFREDKIMAASIIPLLIRMALVHVVLLWGTNNTVTEGFSEVDIRHRQIGSRLVLASRIFYAAFIWTAKWTVLEFLKRITGSYWRRSFEIGLQIIRYFLLAAFVAVVIATLAECQPFDHYWQVVPDPGPQCREGVSQLITMGVCDIVTDLLLVIFPTPIVIMSAMPLARKVSLVLLFSLSLALVGVTAFRVPSTIQRGGAQQYRSLLASLEILAAAAVSNSIAIGSFIRDRGVKRQRYRPHSIGGSSLDRPSSRTAVVVNDHWGSDFDLAADVGMFLSPNLHSKRSSSIASPAQPVPPSSSTVRPSTVTGDDASSLSSTSTNPNADPTTTGNTLQVPHAPGSSTPSNPRKMSFFDVGSLIQSDDRPTSAGPGPREPHNAEPLPSSERTNAETGSASPSLRDVGGLLSQPAAQPPPYTTHPDPKPSKPA